MGRRRHRRMWWPVFRPFLLPPFYSSTDKIEKEHDRRDTRTFTCQPLSQRQPCTMSWSQVSALFGVLPYLTRAHEISFLRVLLLLVQALQSHHHRHPHQCGALNGASTTLLDARDARRVAEMTVLVVTVFGRVVGKGLHGQASPMPRARASAFSSCAGARQAVACRAFEEARAHAATALPIAGALVAALDEGQRGVRGVVGGGEPEPRFSWRRMEQNRANRWTDSNRGGNNDEHGNRRPQVTRHSVDHTWQPFAASIFEHVDEEAVQGRKGAGKKGDGGQRNEELGD